MVPGAKRNIFLILVFAVLVSIAAYLNHLQKQAEIRNDQGNEIGAVVEENSI